MRRSPFFFKHGHVAYQIDGNGEKNRVQVKCIPYDQTGDLGSNIIKFQLQSQFQRFIHQTVCVCSRK